MPLDDPNVGLAFGLTIAAGAATAVGAAVVFVPRLVKLASRKTLAGALALSAGVMTYVSFVEILGKARLKFLEAGYADNVSYMYATVCFFGGVVLMTVRLDWHRVGARLARALSAQYRSSNLWLVPENKPVTMG
jgi:zinc transporter ZupT